MNTTQDTLAGKPIVLRAKMPWGNGLPQGDDDGYDSVAIASDAITNPDPLVRITEYNISECPIYADGTGKVPGVCTFYETGMGATQEMYLRAPVARRLQAADQELRSRFGWRYQAWDTLRLWGTQATMAATIWRRVIARELNKSLEDCTVLELIETGRKARKIGSFAALLRDDAFQKRATKLVATRHGSEFSNAAIALEMDSEEIVDELLTYLGNVPDLYRLNPDYSKDTCHGNGGTVDGGPVIEANGLPVNLGTPFDYTGCSQSGRNWQGLDAFEANSWENYRDDVAADSDLANHLACFGITEITEDDFNQIRADRRRFYWVMENAGFRFYIMEWWHATCGNQDGGNQALTLPGAGNGAHAIVAGIFDRTGEFVCVWDNQTTQVLWEQMNG